MKYLKNNKGSTYVSIIIILMVLAMIFSVTMEYIRIYNQLLQVREGAEKALVSLATDNWDENFKSVREGYSGAYQKDSTNTWKEVFEPEDVENQLREVLGLNKSNEKQGTSGYYYRIKTFDVEQINSTFKNKTEVVVIKANVIVEIPFRSIFAGIPPIPIELKVQSKYQRKF